MNSIGIPSLSAMLLRALRFEFSSSSPSVNIIADDIEDENVGRVKVNTKKK